MQESKAKKPSFSQRHPFLFGFGLIFAAMVLLIGAMVAFRYIVIDGDARPLISGDSLGLVNIKGVIMDSREVNKWIEKLREDDNILGVLIRVDSPGGGVSPSQEIHRAVRKLAAKKPVVVSVGTVAASGGYYVSSPAHKIIANPGSITGSIGVRMDMANFMGLMDMIGVGQQSLVSGKFKDAGSPFKPLSKEDKAYFNSVIMDMYDQFVSDVAKDRKLDPAKVRAVADGRVFTGRQAQVEGLIDGLGGQEEALDILKRLCKVSKDKDLPVREGPVKEKNFLQQLVKESASTLVNELKTLRAEQSSTPHWQFSY